MPKPTMKTKCAVSGVYEYTRTIFMDTTEDVLRELGLYDFGHIRNSAEYGYPNSYCLDVDSRYDFLKVVAYILEKYPQKIKNSIIKE